MAYNIRKRKGVPIAYKSSGGAEVEVEMKAVLARQAGKPLMKATVIASHRFR